MKKKTSKTSESLTSIRVLQSCYKLGLKSPKWYTSRHYKLKHKKYSYSDETEGEHMYYTYNLLSYWRATKQEKYWPV